MLAWLFWNPDPVCFIAPFVGRPILWYGACWAVGFVVALVLTFEIVKRAFVYAPYFIAGDIKKGLIIRDKLKSMYGVDGDTVLDILNGLLEGKELGTPRGWGNRFLLAFAKGRLTIEGLRRVQNRFFLDEQLKGSVVSLRKRAHELGERGWMYIMVGTVIGARLGHILFYHHPTEYLFSPMKIFMIWEGGLASHGATAGILISLWLFWKRHNGVYPMQNVFGWADLSVIPVLFGCAMIRIGNFFNQELLGTASELPWAIIFGSPEDGGLPLPRHPVQLYEAGLYLVLIGVFYRVFFRREDMTLPQGVLTGLLLVNVFGFRFLVEFVKENQGYFDPHLPLHMGQLLSLPFILLGGLLIAQRRRRRARSFVLGS